jgi:predicted transcriptional regulator of viral defense system
MGMPHFTKTDQLTELSRRQSIIRRAARCAARAHSQEYLTRLVERGELRKLGRGMYTSATVPASEHASLLDVRRNIPNGVICLLSY